MGGNVHGICKRAKRVDRVEKGRKEKNGRVLGLGAEVAIEEQVAMIESIIFPRTFLIRFSHNHSPYYNSPSTNTESVSVPLNGVPALIIFPPPS
jgi:hypothetical protein